MNIGLSAKRAVIFLLAAPVFALFSISALGGNTGFSSRLSESEGRCGDTVELSIPYDGSAGEVGAFAVQVEFPEDTFSYVRTVTDASIRDSYSLTKEEAGLIRSVYVARLSNFLKQADKTFTYRLQVREDAEPGDAVLSVSVYQILSPDSEPLPSLEERLTFSVPPPLSSESYLVSLVPDNGTLEPDFSPDCFSYTVQVPFSVTSMTFFAEPAAGGVCKVNRKNLGAGGSDTLFVLTVTAEDGKTKSEYQITVHREEKPASSPSEADPVPGKTSAPQKTAAPVKEQTVLEQERPTPSPTQHPTEPPQEKPDNAAPVSANTQERTKAVNGQVHPSVTVQNGNSSALPAFLTALSFGFACVVFRPLSRWIASGRKQEQQDSPEDPEKNDPDNQDEKP